jgi:hypothetical protein
MNPWGAAAAELDQASYHGDLVHTTPAGLRTYLRGDVLTAAGPNVSTLRHVVAGVNLAALR